MTDTSTPRLNSARVSQACTGAAAIAVLAGLVAVATLPATAGANPVKNGNAPGNSGNTPAANNGSSPGNSGNTPAAQNWNNGNAGGNSGNSGGGGGSPATVIAPELPETLMLTAIIRDFRAHGEAGGHPDFQRYTGSHAAVGLVSEYLGSDGKPQLASTKGRVISSEWRNAAGRPIMPGLYNAQLGDTPGSFVAGESTQISSTNGVNRFNEWFNDTPGVNQSKQVDITLVRQGNTSVYVFDSALHEPYKSKGGFFPIDNDLFGNYEGWNKNFHFTTEIETEFIFHRDANHTFMFTGDDDVWVFIDGQLVIDLGGLHPRREQMIDLNRLEWLECGESYSLKVFHAERRTSESNFRIETTLQLRTINLPATAGMFD